jgi:hypothetical protein
MIPESDRTARSQHAHCIQCGAVGCKEKCGEMLAPEFEQPAVFGTVHHLTIICYNIQHPDEFTDEALEWMRSSLRTIVSEGLSPQEFRERAGKNVEAGKLKVRRHAAPAETSRRTP